MDNKLAKRLRRIRIQHGYTSMQELANKLETNLNNVKGWERESKPVLPGVDYLLKMCELYDCDLDYLTGRREETTYDIHCICEYTGLSEKAIRKISSAKAALNGVPVASPLVHALNHLIEADGFQDFMRAYQTFLIAADRLKTSTIPEAIPYPVNEDGAYVIEGSAISPEGAQTVIDRDRVILRADDATRYFMHEAAQALMRLCESDYQESSKVCMKNSKHRKGQRMKRTGGKNNG